MNSAACLRREVLRSLRNRKLILRAAALVFAGVASIGGASASEPSFLVLRFSTTTDFERPWLKFCRTWPDSTVRCSDSGLRAPPRRVLSVVSFVSVMLFP